ncbi:Troponin C, isoform 2 [Chionoecetes opilio]|uniref:Troponin C, isoform 2 n=1 Tax=Chionoecetes opilio TaxID=41210 RepID=A0A8J4Y586_CHIOP|nr:Troponin C, isoform 2 [Chionoecetes opilio]
MSHATNRNKVATGAAEEEEEEEEEEEGSRANATEMSTEATRSTAYASVFTFTFTQLNPLRPRTPQGSSRPHLTVPKLLPPHLKSQAPPAHLTVPRLLPPTSSPKAPPAPPHSPQGSSRPHLTVPQGSSRPHLTVPQGSSRPHLSPPRLLPPPPYSPPRLLPSPSQSLTLPPAPASLLATMLLRRAFDSFDENKKGAINIDTVATILRMMGQSVPRSVLEEVIKEVDVDGSGELEFNEFVLLAIKFMNEDDEEELLKELKEAFRLYDKKGQGFIPVAVLREILKELDSKLTNEELDGIIEEIDEDGSGTVDFDEFKEMMMG